MRGHYYLCALRLRNTNNIMDKTKTINEEVDIPISPSEFEAIQYALTSLVRHESVTSDTHYGYVHTASEFLERVVRASEKDRVNPFWGSDYQ